MTTLHKTKNSIALPIAVIFEDSIFLHSAMASGNSLWSAGQRRLAAKKKGKVLTAKKTQLSLSWPVAQAIAQLVRKHDGAYQED